MKLAVRVPNWVGDAVMAMPALNNARPMTGADHIAVIARPSTAPLFRNHPDIDRVVVIDDKSSRLKGPREAAALLKTEEYDVGVILPPSFSSAFIFKLAHVKGRIGFAGDRRSLLLTRAVEPPDEPMHRVRQYLYLFEKLTGRKATLSNPQVYLSHEDIEQGGAVLETAGFNYDDPYIAVAPRAVAESRRWGTENYGRLADRLAQSYNCRVLLMGTADDAEAGQEVRAHNPEAIVNLCGKTGLMQAAAIISFARLFVGNDSGLAHLAGAVRCPVAVLSGPDNPEETSPLCVHKKVIIRDELDCISCVKNQCPKKGDAFMLCMKQITVDEVFDAAQNLYRA